MKTKPKQLATRHNLRGQEEYRLLLEFMNQVPDVIYFKDLKGRLILVNQAHAKGLGLKPEQVVGKTDFDIFPKERAKKMAEDDLSVMKTGKPIIDKIERATRADGIDNYVSTSKIPRYDEKGRIAGLIGITRDITRRMHYEHLVEERARMQKKLEVLEGLNKVKSEFISVASHELRTPLAIVRQLLMFLFADSAGAINNKQREILKKAVDNTDRLKNIIEELLDISRFESGKFKLHYSLVNFNDLIRDSANFFKGLADEKGIILDYSFPEKLVNLFIDPERINQVITNLITNAIKFTEDGGRINVEVSIMQDKVRVGVIDTGIGIAKADVSKLFNKFIQVSKVSGAEKKGLGLGLSIVKELVERHGGEIWVESKLGVGSRFYFTLPRFYTAKILNKEMGERINSLLARGIIVHFINLCIINYEQFKNTMKIKPAKLFKDLEAIINSVLKSISRLKKEKSQIFVATDIRYGRCGIILSRAKEALINKAAGLLKDKMKDYFNKNKAENVFVTLGVLSFPPHEHLRRDKGVSANIYMREIYIGSEMRRFKRIPYESDIEIIAGDKREFSKTADISEGGVCLFTEIVLKTDSEIKINLALVKTEGAITSNARVAWIKKSHRGPHETAERHKVGLEFVNLKDNEKKLLYKELKLLSK